MKIKKILIANRGEIALRVIKTARVLGIKTVALYADDDRSLPHVWQADEAIALGSGELKDTYLNQEKILRAAQATHADAIHPGYGFLSENALFCEAVEKAGLIFIGPTARAIRLMGDKIGSKIEAQKYHVPLIPGYHGDDQSPERLLKEAQAIGFPVLIKASAGGGGKGMRIVHAEAEFLAALNGAKSEAKKAFGNDAVLVEKYITQPRHIEVQVMSDTHGQHFHFFERECSIQRRYQKVIEETPAPGLSAKTRQDICETAVRIARGIDYRGAGTVEFVMAADESFYFLEMNTRLQVEHPITELVTGVDLVALQIRVAAGEKLALNQQQIFQRGHAIELRICAEDPDKGFLPTVGKIQHIGFPTGHGVRLDCGYVDGAEVGVNYDPMLAKLIAWGTDRSDAIARVYQALDEVRFVGITSNRDYLRRLLCHPKFQAGRTHTHFIPDHAEELKPRQVSAAAKALAIAGHILTNKASSSVASQGSSGVTPWTQIGGARL